MCELVFHRMVVCCFLKKLFWLLVCFCCEFVLVFFRKNVGGSDERNLC